MRTRVSATAAWLTTVLAGAFEALPLLSEGDTFRAMHVMMTVDAPCRVAQRVLNGPGEAAGR